jgi:hypothetical protein
MANQKVRETPRMSVNGLAEYLVAGAARRQKIILEQKRPKDFQVIYYDEAEEAIIDHLASQRKSTAGFDTALSKLQLAGDLKEWEFTRRSTGMDAIQAFLGFVGEIPLTDLHVKRAPTSPRLLQVGGVGVSVRPELHLSYPVTEQRIGAIKLYFSKNDPLSEDRARYAATVLHQYIETQYPKAGKADYRLCFVVDAFAKRFFSAPRNHKRKQQDVEAACREIAIAWPFA